MKNTIQKFKQSFIAFEKPGISSENFKILTSSNYPTAQYFLLKLRLSFLLINVYKRVCGTFLLCLDPELFGKIKKDRISTNSFFTLYYFIFYITLLHFDTLISFHTLIFQDLSKIKQIPHTLLWTLLSRKRVPNFSQKH